MQTASEIARLVQTRQARPVDIVASQLERIDALDPELGAFVLVRREQALVEAEALAARPDLAQLPLAGVPVAVKDNVDVAGEPTRYGSAATRPDPAPRDDELVRRLREAGAVVIGKTKLPELAIWPFTEPEAGGPARNPWDRSRTTGGSTGGGGAAVAAGMAPLALGSDGGGSLRIPAACCGVVGLKPTPGIVPLAGGAESHWYGCSAFGALASTVEDAALMLSVLAADPSFRTLPPRAETLRLAVSTKHPSAGARIRADVRAAVAETADALRGAGHDVRDANPPYRLRDSPAFVRRWLGGIAEDADTLELDVAAVEPATRGMIRAGRRLRRIAPGRPISTDPAGERMRRWFADYDVLLTATLAGPAVPVGTWSHKGWLRPALGVANWILTPIWNLCGFPAASIPAGLSEEGLPLAVQLVAAPGNEATLIAVAAQLERLRPWPRWEQRTATAAVPAA